MNDMRQSESEGDVTGTATWLLGAGIVFGLAYLPMAAGAPSWRRSLLKTLPLLAFAVAAYLRDAPPLLAVGLMLSAAGDLALSRAGNRAFFYGLACFALAHILYMLTFMSLSGLALWDAFLVVPLIASAGMGLAFSTEIWLAPFTGSLRWAVRLYVGVITLMMMAALGLANIAWLAALGAVLFVAYDMVLAVQMFRLQTQYRHFGVAGRVAWGLYVAAQALIAWSVKGI